MMVLLLLKVTLLCGLALFALGFTRTSAALRHLICAGALLGALLMPGTLLVPPESVAFQLDAASLASSPRVPAAARASLTEVFALLWAVGLIVILLRIAAGYLAVSTLRKGGVRAKMSLPVPVYFAGVSVPLVSGLLRPTIYLPRAAQFWSASHIDAALRHELQHVARYDLWTMLLGRLTCALYWFHPLVWLISWRLQEEQESACDDAVLADGFEPAGYAEVLLLAGRQMNSTQLIGCSMLTNKSLKHRIARVLDNSLTRASSTTRLRAAAGISAGVIALVGLLAGTPRAHAWQDQPYKVGDGVTAPRLIHKVEPAYTPEAKEAKIEGTVVLSVIVGPDGLAQDVRVLRGLGSGLDEKAVDVVAQEWRFAPGTKDGQPVSVRATIEINFRLR